MISDALPNILGQRYRLLNILGAGGMGCVYRAIDRLTGQVLALKRVLVPTTELVIATRTAPETDFHIALAQEFQLLASLRHPSIIGVLDYGFDSQRQPFLTMELIENAQTIHEAARNQPLSVQVELLTQLLQALAYLHRRNVVHRDLKPNNVLVKSGQVKVLDFGISTLTGTKPSAISGTVLYMAPEVLRGEPAGSAADLYAVGVLTYELLEGHTPFASDTPSKLIENILTTPLEVILSGMDSPVAKVLERLLAKTPEDRYSSATEVIAALSELVHQPVVLETSTSRESLLQSTKLVGRDTELTLLSDNLAQTIVGLGSSLLIGGENGIGKSRLLEELRTLALVQGTLVLRGNTLSSGGRPYEVWREPLRRLALAANLDDEEAGVLKSLVPDIGLLLERDIPDAPEFDAQATQGRLLSTVTNILKRHEQPMVILLENLHLADVESLMLLQWLSQIVAWLPVMIVGSFQDDERPELAKFLPEMNLVKLRRLSDQAIADLSESLLGSIGRRDKIVELLQRETEGNPLFVVEVVRTLAEEAGQLDKIGSMVLPEHVFSGGVRRIVERRLSRVPEDSWPLLRFAAVAGSQLDLQMLRVLSPTTNLDQWLTGCANLGIFELDDEQWHFSHDKLRQGILVNLDAQQMQDHHRQIAATIESLATSQSNQAAILAYHWGEAQDKAKERYYSAIAGENALRSGAYQTAVTYLTRALDLGALAAPSQQDSKTRVRRAYLMRLLAGAYYGAGELAKSREEQEAALQLLGYPMPNTRASLVAGTLEQTLLQVPHQFLPSRTAKPSQDKRAVLFEATMGYQQLVQLCFFSGEPLALIHAALRSLNLVESLGDVPPAIYAQALADMGTATAFIPIHSRAETYYQRARTMVQDLPEATTVSWVLQLAATYDMTTGQWARALESLNRAVEIADRIGHRRRWQESSTMLAIALAYTGDFARAAQIRNDISTAIRRSSSPSSRAGILLFQAESALLLGQINEALPLLDEVAEMLGDNAAPMPKMRLHALNALTTLYIGENEVARQAADQALQEITKSQLRSIYLLSAYSAVASVYVALWEVNSLQSSPATRDLAERTQQAWDVLQKNARVYPISQPGIWRLRGLIDWLSGNQDRAKKAWQRSLQFAEQFSMPFEQGLAHYEIGRHLDTQDPDRKTHLAQALAIFEKLGALYQLARTKME